MKKLFLLISLLFISSSVFAACIKGNCSNGFGTYEWTDGDKYVGEWNDGKNEGQGTYIFSDGNKYVGEHKDGKRDGQGTFTYADGKIEKGIWKNNKLIEKNNKSNYITKKKKEYITKKENPDKANDIIKEPKRTFEPYSKPKF